MSKSLAELCEVLGQYGMRAELDGDPEHRVGSVATLEEAGPGQVSFLSNPKYERALARTSASAVVVSPDQRVPSGIHAVRTEEPYGAITAMIVALHGYRQHVAPRMTGQQTIDPTARVGENATIYPGVTIDREAVVGDNAVLYPGVYIGPRARLGNDVTLFPNVVVYDDCLIGDRVTIHAGTVIGQDGLGYAPLGGRWVKIPQIGIAEIGDDVEIGSNCSIDRATLGRTVIGNGTKFSNLIAIGHGTQIGEHCMFVAHVGLAGSVHVGDHVTMAGQAGVVGHIRIGDHATIGAKAGVINNVPDGETFLGQPAVPINEAKRRLVHAAHLPEMAKTLKALKRKVAELEQKAAGNREQGTGKPG